MVLSIFPFLCKESAELFHLTTKNKDVTHITSVARDPHTQSRQHPDNSKGLPCGSAVKNLPAVQEMWVRSLNREDPLEKGIATHSSILGLGNLLDREALAAPWGRRIPDSSVWTPTTNIFTLRSISCGMYLVPSFLSVLSAKKSVASGSAPSWRLSVSKWRMSMLCKLSISPITCRG